MITRIVRGMTDVEQREYFARIEQDVLRPRLRHASLVVSDDSTVWTTGQRAHHMAWHRQHRELLREICLGTAFVMPDASVVVRFALSAMMMLTTGSPCQILRDEESARHWTRKLVEKSSRAVVQSSTT